MKSLQFVFLIFLMFDFSTGIAIAHSNSNDGELIFAHVIYRHGDRNIQKLYPNDPYKDEIHWPGGYGQLTNRGKQQHYELGQYFRRRYDKLIGDKYSANKVYVRSTDVDRTIMSAQANLAALFPPTKDEIWNDDIHWQPIPVHSVPMEFDNVLFSDRNCPKYNIVYEKYLKESPDVQEIYTKYADHLINWSKKCGLNITRPTEVQDLYSTLYMEKTHNKSLPDWAQQAIESNGVLEFMSKHSFKVQTDTKQLARLKSGFFIKAMFERFAQKINSTLKPDRSLWFYSAHDFIIADTLNSLELFELHIPPYAASIHLELFKTNTNDHYIQLFYRKTNEEHPTPMKIPNCGEMCSLDRLYEVYSEIIPGDFDSECALL